MALHYQLVCVTIMILCCCHWEVDEEEEVEEVLGACASAEATGKILSY